jgi:hypothetical protein
MGKSTSKIIETLYVSGDPKRYVVTNTDKIILVTHDIRFAEKIASVIANIDDPKNYYLKIR